MSGLGMGFLTMGYGSLQKAGQPQLRAGDILVVIHDFNARSSDELTLRKSDRVELIELDEGFGDGWFLGRHLTRGDTGLFPGVYTTRAPPTPGRPPPPPPQAYNRTSYSPPMSTFSNTPLSPIPPSPADYQPSNSPVEPTSKASPYSPAFAYDSPRTSLPASYTAHAPVVQRSIGQTLGEGRSGEDSPVMNETLSVIDEHITDLSTPRQSLAVQKTIHEDSGSDYSSRVDQQSYVAGPETDDEENGRLNEAEVRQWDHKKMAQHLRSIGVDSKHCDIFEEQEISGEVLLEMDQGFIYMKEYDFGVMGRRLKTWHKIRDFQNEVRGIKPSRQGTQSSIDGNSSIEDVNRSQKRLLSNGALLPRIPSLMENSAMDARQSQYSTASQDDTHAGLSPLSPPGVLPRSGLGAQTPPSPWRASMISDTSGRPSAAMVRELSHSRRHSSIDYSKPSDLKISSPTLGISHTTHQKQPSLDRDWSLSTSTFGMTNSPTIINSPKDMPSRSAGLSPPVVTNLDPEVDRGYFSGNEVDNRKQRNMLRKRESTGGSAMHSRQASANNAAMKRHSRLPSADSIRDISPQTFSPAAKAYHQGGFKGRFRSSSARESISKIGNNAGSPTVTNLETTSTGAPPPRVVSAGAQPKPSLQNKAKKLIGMRAASENTAANEKTISLPEQNQESGRASPVASPTGSTTPSGTSRSLEYDGPEAPSKLNDIQGLTLPKAQARTRPKAKQETSAYQRGLLKLTPAEARKNCDYHGWMKKKSSSLITTWKPRLFILRGRRLSYYYSEADTEERGIIDISGHKVLVANSDAMVTLHAQITGATSTASPNSVPSSTETSPTLTKSPEPGSSSPFYFKLVPPKSGMSRAVQFTKPTIHYFQCDSIAEGRKWMGEIMKATIEHDLSSFETTNKQKTISLAKARARQERPPALQDTQEPTEPGALPQDNKENVRESGLNIQGLNFADSPISLEFTNEKNKDGTNASLHSGTNTVGSAPAEPPTYTK